MNVAFGDEGWGLTRSRDGAVLYLTDSTDRLFHVNATTFEVLRTVPIVDERLDGGVGRHIFGVNELELVGDEVWGNVYPTCSADGGTSRRVLCDHSECVVRLDPTTGRVVGWLDLTSLPERESASVRNDAMNSVLNGIAYHAATDRLLVTGKNWDNIHQIAPMATDLGPEHIESVCRLAPS